LPWHSFTATNKHTLPPLLLYIYFFCACSSDVDLQITQWDVQGNTLEAHWRFSAILDLPWKPRLAAAGASLSTKL
jgi:hypothetical protein